MIKFFLRCPEALKLVAKSAFRSKATAPAARAPVFIVGCGHSGTSVLLRIVGAHSAFYTIPIESRFAMQPKATHGLYHRVFDRMARANGKGGWVEKTPGHIRHIDSLLDVHPEAKVIVIVRDGRDVAASLRKRTGDLEAAVARWLHDNAKAAPFFDHPRVGVVRYEDMVTDFDGFLSEVMGVLGLDPEQAQRAFHLQDGNHFTSSSSSRGKKTEHDRLREWQVSQPIFDGRGRWKEELTPEEQAYVDEKMQVALDAMSYAACCPDSRPFMRPSG